MSSSLLVSSTWQNLNLFSFLLEGKTARGRVVLCVAMTTKHQSNHLNSIQWQTNWKTETEQILLIIEKHLHSRQTCEFHFMSAELKLVPSNLTGTRSWCIQGAEYKLCQKHACLHVRPAVCQTDLWMQRVQSQVSSRLENKAKNYPECMRNKVVRKWYSFLFNSPYTGLCVDWSAINL